MAIPPSVIPLAPQGIAGVAAAQDGAVEGAAALPGGFLGMLGGLTAGVPTITTSETVATTAEALFGLVSKTAAPDAVAPGVDSADAGLSPEAAAAAMAVMAQMLAGTPTAVAQATVAQTAVAQAGVAEAGAEAQSIVTSPRALPSQPAGTASAAALTAAQVQVRAPLATDPRSLVADVANVADVATDATALASQGPAVPLAPLQLRQSGAQSGGAAPAPNASQDAVDAADTSGFQPLTALLSAVARSDGAADSKPTAASTAPASPIADDARLGALSSTAANTGSARDAAQSNAQQAVLIREPVGTAQWADSIGARLTMMATRGEQRGALRLSPEHLGPVEVQIRLQDDKASVWFGAQQADTRAALQDALPRLRELFAAQGMQLGDAGVSREPPRQDAMPSRSPTPGLAGAAGTPDATELAVALPAVGAGRHLGALDTYA